MYVTQIEKRNKAEERTDRDRQIPYYTKLTYTITGTGLVNASAILAQQHGTHYHLIFGQ